MHSVSHAPQIPDAQTLACMTAYALTLSNATQQPCRQEMVVVAQCVYVLITKTGESQRRSGESALTTTQARAHAERVPKLSKMLSNYQLSVLQWCLTVLGRYSQRTW
jgi:hypothetical protein